MDLKADGDDVLGVGRGHHLVVAEPETDPVPQLSMKSSAPKIRQGKKPKSSSSSSSNSGQWKKSRNLAAGSRRKKRAPPFILVIVTGYFTILFKLID